MHKIPLYLQILAALVVAVIVGVLLGAGNPILDKDVIDRLALPCDLILKALRTLATPLIFLAIINTFLTAEIPGNSGRKLSILLITNTVVAIGIGLFVANVLRPGAGGQALSVSQDKQAAVKQLDPWKLLSELVPDSVVKPLVDNNIISLIFVALAFGIVLRAIKTEQIGRGVRDYIAIERTIGILFDAVIRILHWVIVLVPFAVFGIVARTIALQGFEPFKSLGSFVLAVIVALLLQATYYLLRVKFGSWLSPQEFIKGGSDALITAFSTASSTATMPITFEVLQKLGLRKSSASLGALVGSNFNNDGTALYEAMSALFISQVLGQNLSLVQQLMVVLTSIVASVGAAGIPNAGLVTMTLVFSSVGLPTVYIAILITVDWFLDRCRTAINVMGDMTVSAVIDGKHRQTQAEAIGVIPTEEL